MRSILTYVYVVFFLIYSIFPLRKLKRLRREGKLKEARAFQYEVCTSFGKACIAITGSKVRVIGAENVPKDRSCVFVSNHQGIFDIHTFLGYAGTAVGLVSKIENRKLPIIGDWMEEMDCVFIERGNPRNSLLQIGKAAKLVQEGLNMVIFPEGTRSKADVLGEFKQGSLKLATKSKAPIIPVTLSGTYHLFEEHNKIIKPGKITMVFGEPIETKDLTKEEESVLLEKVVSVISGNLQKILTNEI